MKIAPNEGQEVIFVETIIKIHHFCFDCILSKLSQIYSELPLAMPLLKFENISLEKLSSNCFYIKYCVICYREYGDAHGDRHTDRQTHTRAYVGSTTCESAKVNLFAFYRALFRKSDKPRVVRKRTTRRKGQNTFIQLRRNKEQEGNYSKCRYGGKEHLTLIRV